MTDTNKVVQPGMTTQQAAVWFNSQVQRASQYLANQGVTIAKVDQDKSTYVAPLFAILSIRSADKKRFWVIVGDLPTDFIPVNTAKDARQALRHFALHWQLKAEQMIQAGLRDKIQRDYAQLLVTKSEAIYPFIDNSSIWQHTS